MPDTHVDFTEDDVDDAADDNQEVKHIPGVTKIALGRTAWENPRVSFSGKEFGWPTRGGGPQPR